MPIYEYVCEKCGQVFERWQKISDDPVDEHEGCGGHAHRVISATTFSLKGDGWYKDHYGLKSTKSQASSSPPSASSKPAPKPASDAAKKSAA